MSHDEPPHGDEYAEYYGKYIALVPEGDIVAILATQLDDTLALLRELSDADARYAYAPGKWSVKEVIGHLADTERILAYRMLRFSRGDATPLPSFDENHYAAAGGFTNRKLPSLLAEMTAVRSATIALLAGLPRDVWRREGIASGWPVSVRAIAWIIAGHELHHRAILAERYLTRSEAPSAIH
ncbi:DinB family protein [soil metagenome]